MATLRFVSRAAIAASSALVLAAAVTLVACATDDSTVPGPKGDSGVATFESDAAGGGGDSSTADAGVEAGPKPVNNCTVFVDRSDPGASRELRWDIDSVPQLPEHCMTIKVGQTVKLVRAPSTAADFAEHPATVFLPGGGAAPTVDETTGNVVFTVAGTFGLSCQIHPSMKAAIKVE